MHSNLGTCTCECYFKENILQCVRPLFCQISCHSTPDFLHIWARLTDAINMFHTNTSINMFYFNVQRFSVYTYMQSNHVPAPLHPLMGQQAVMDLSLLVLEAEWHTPVTVVTPYQEVAIGHVTQADFGQEQLQIVWKVHRFPYLILFVVYTTYMTEYSDKCY